MSFYLYSILTTYLHVLRKEVDKDKNEGLETYLSHSAQSINVDRKILLGITTVNQSLF
jgi:hypothetical protein